MLGIILLVLLVLLLVGGIPAYGPTGTPYGFYGTGFAGGGILGTVLIIVLILVLLGRV